jgi:hypothetical protein
VERNVWGRGGSREPQIGEVVPTAVARALGTSRRAAEAALWGPMNLARRCARVITALKVAGDDEALVRFIQPIDLAIHAAQPAALTEEERLGAHSGVSLAPMPAGRNEQGKAHHLEGTNPLD